MHVGGAALDGFLALTVPFAVWELRRSYGVLRTAAALWLSGVAVYACLTTFSRGLYLAIPVGLGVLWLLLIRQRRAALAPAGALSSAGKVLALATLGAAAFYFVFRFGGYRALLAFVATVGVAMHVASTDGKACLKAVQLVRALLIGLLLGTLDTLIPRSFQGTVPRFRDSVCVQRRQLSAEPGIGALQRHDFTLGAPSVARRSRSNGGLALGRPKRVSRQRPRGDLSSRRYGREPLDSEYVGSRGPADALGLDCHVDASRRLGCGTCWGRIHG
jgi:hypothetical protein